MGRYMRILAGDSIFQMVRDGGLKLDGVRVIAGAAGGPKWLILYHFDRFIASLIPKKKIGKNLLCLIGSSIGAWRMTALSCADPLAVIDEFFHAYMEQRYSMNPSVKEITTEAVKILNAFLTGERLKEPFQNPLCRLSILAVRHRNKIGASERKLTLLPVIALIGLTNIISRKTLGYFLDRVVFADPRDSLPVDFSVDPFPTEIISLSERNIREALLASGAIPLVMEAIHKIDGAPPGTYRDGGLLDYHLDLPYNLDGDCFVLYPHYTDRIIPGWFDKYRPRKPRAGNVKRLLIVCPTKTLVENLPGGKIPDRNDFYIFKGRDNERLLYWKKAVEAGKWMAEEFFEALESGRLKDYVEPLET